MESVPTTITRALSAYNRGNLLFPNDFRGKGTQGAIKMALSRLVKEGKLKRIAHGIYYIPLIDPVLGELQPAAEAVAEQLAEREKVRIRPTGSFALNKLGLSTQVPTKLVYLTDGHPRKLKIGQATVEFRATTPKKMALKGSISSLLVLGLEELDLEHLDKNLEHQIYAALQMEQPGDLQHDLRLASAKVYNYLYPYIKKINDDGMAFFNGGPATHLS